MKIRRFNEKEIEVEPGDFVVFKLDDFSVNTWLDNRLQNEIGKVLRVRELNFGGELDVELEDGETIFGVSVSRVDKWSKNKDELEAYLSAKNYNL